MVADIVDIVGLFLAVLLAGEDAADVGLALGAGAEAGGVGQEGLEELDGHDLLAVELDGRGGQHPHVLQAAHVVEVALAEGHEEADALSLRDVLGQRLDLLVMEQVHVLFAHLIEVVLPLDAHGRDLDPVAVLPVAAGGRDLAQVDFRVEVGGEGVAVVAAVAVEDVDGVDGVELVLLGVGAVSLGHTRIEAAAQQRGQAGFLKLFGIGPLPAVIEVGRETGLLAALLVDGAPLRVVRVLRLVVGGVHVVDAAGQAGVHDGQILIGQGDVHHEVGLVALDEGDHFVHLVGVHLGGGDLGGSLGGQLSRELVALGLGAACDADLGKHFGDLAALVDGDGSHAAAADDQNFAHGRFLLCYHVSQRRASACAWFHQTWKPGQPLSSAISSSRRTLQAVAVETPVVSSVGASSLRSAPTMFALVTVRMASSSCKKLTPPASGVPVPGKQEGSRQSRSMVR